MPEQLAEAQPTWPNAVYARLADVLRARAGLVFQTLRRPTVEAAAQRVMKRVGIHTPDDFVAVVAQTGPVFDDLMAEVTIGETYFFREAGHFALLRDHLAPRLVGEDPDEIERLWKRLFFHTHATAVGAITSLALAAIDTALWDLRGKRTGLPLWKLAGGAQRRVPTYTTEGGWLQLGVDELVDQALAARDKGFKGTKMKVGKPHHGKVRHVGGKVVYTPAAGFTGKDVFTYTVRNGVGVKRTGKIIVHVTA